MKLTPIPHSFVREHASLSWREALWGYERQLIGWSNIVAIADDKLLAGSNDPLEIELSNLGKVDTQKIGELFRILAENEPVNDGVFSCKKWLYIALAWLFENRDKISDPLDEVEIIYSEFDYPPEVESFVNYMPATDGYDPSKHSLEENRARLFSKWERYLSEARCQVVSRK